MLTTIAQVVTTLLMGYAALGLMFAFYFAFVGAHRLDPSAKNGTWGFRLLIIPGSAALWPLLMMRLLRGQGRPPTEQNGHRQAAVKGSSS